MSTERVSLSQLCSHSETFQNSYSGLIIPFWKWIKLKRKKALLFWNMSIRTGASAETLLWKSYSGESPSTKSPQMTSPLRTSWPNVFPNACSTASPEPLVFIPPRAITWGKMGHYLFRGGPQGAARGSSIPVPCLGGSPYLAGTCSRRWCLRSGGTSLRSGRARGCRARRDARSSARCTPACRSTGKCPPRWCSSRRSCRRAARCCIRSRPACSWPRGSRRCSGRCSGLRRGRTGPRWRRGWRRRGRPAGRFCLGRAGKEDEDANWWELSLHWGAEPALGLCS